MRNFLLLFFLLFSFVAHAQTDSVRTEYSQEIAGQDTIVQRSGSRFLKAYRKFIQAQVEEKTLIKVGALPQWGLNLNEQVYGGFTSQVAVEQKLVPSVSVLAAILTQYRNFGQYGRDATMNVRVAGRWYYAMNRLVRERRSANNFSGQYLSFQVNLPVYAGQNRLADPTTALTTYAWTGLALGSQRRLGKFGYVDLTFGLGYPLQPPAKLVLSASVTVGVGL